MQFTDVACKRTEAGDLLLDYYGPAGPGPSPVVFRICGGGWKSGGKGDVQGRFGWLLDHGIAICGLSYRSSDQALFPAAVEDVIDGVRFVVENQREYGVDPHRLYLSGDSAGAHLAVMAGLWITAPERSFPMPSLSIAGIIAIGLPENLETNERIDEFVVPFLGTSPSQDPHKARQASPHHALHAAMPPMLLFLGEDDHLFPVSRQETFRDAVRKAGGWAELNVLPGVGHELDPVLADEAVRRRIAAFAGRR